jgi:hypothetical protein
MGGAGRSPVPMQARSYLSYLIYLGGGLLLLLHDGGAHGSAWAGVLILWFLTFTVAQFWLLKCPHCAKLAIFRPSGWASPWVGSRCRYCGKKY